MTKLKPLQREKLRNTFRAGADVTHTGREYGLSRDDLRSELKDFITQSDRLARRATKTFVQFTNEDICNAIRSVKTTAENGPTSAEYRRACLARPELPSVALLSGRFGTYNGALIAAGFKRDTGPRSDRHWTRENVEQALKVIAGELGELPTFRAYSKIRAGRSDWPSGGTIRVRVGTWAEARAIAASGPT